MNAYTAPRKARAFTETTAFAVVARSGHVARGVIYLLIGLLAIRLALGVGSAPPSQQGAMTKIAQQPFGHALLVLMAIGFGGYALWRLSETLVGHTPEYGQHSAMERVAAGGSCIAYTVFCALAIAVISGGGGTSSAKPNRTTAGVLQWPAGRELVAAAGVLFIGVAGYQVYQALSRKFLKHSKTERMGSAVLKAFTAVGIVGLLARGVAFALIGVFVLKAAIDYNPNQAVGLDGALARLTQHSYGAAALILVAAGLIAFGVHSIADARYRKI